MSDFEKIFKEMQKDILTDFLRPCEIGIERTMGQATITVKGSSVQCMALLDELSEKVISIVGEGDREEMLHLLRFHTDNISDSIKRGDMDKCEQ
ncbi:MAG: hypothetical protein LUI12_01670 [Clostridiales bacterium]|nr:hypothetical protein [Clostridiales bacterium]